MRCNKCHKRMDADVTELVFECDGAQRKAVNVPADKCPRCGNVMISELVMEKVYDLARSHPSLTIDCIPKAN